ncbi:dihydrodipicolinate synthase family protein [Clostridia bacterium]|nr:dihydrodipicolinate synthase family protein [Clostridia bacterium]
MQHTESWVTMITPFTDDGRIDLAAIPLLVDYYAETCDGIFAVCQSSEMHCLTLSERETLARAVIHAANGRVPIVVSGHISNSLEQQVEEARRLSDVGAEAFVLVSNRLAKEDESDDLWIDRLDYLINNTTGALGMYECPHPYKRLLSDRTLDYIARTGRFTFFKDTCCDAAMIEHRLLCIDGTAMRLFNANSTTLLQSLRDGASGFSGVMANFHPELYQWLCHNWFAQPTKANALQGDLAVLSQIEQMGYPACAKMHLRMLGLPVNAYCRNDAHKRMPSNMPDILSKFRETELSLCNQLDIVAKTA